MSRNITVATAVRDLLNNAPANTFPQAFAAKLELLPYKALEDADGLSVFVAVSQDHGSPWTRGQQLHSLTQDIIICCPLDPEATDPSDPDKQQQIFDLLALVESIGDFLRIGTVLGNIEAKIDASGHEPLYDQATLHLEHRFLSVVRLGIKTT